MSETDGPATVDVALAVPVKSGKLLVARRPAGGHLAGQWEFPGGKVDPGEQPEGTARRELQEETGLTVTELEPLLVFVYEYPDRSLRLHAYLARDPRGALCEGPQEWSWKSLAELRDLEMPPANEQILRALRWRIEPAAR